MPLALASLLLLALSPFRRLLLVCLACLAVCTLQAKAQQPPLPATLGGSGILAVPGSQEGYGPEHNALPLGGLNDAEWHAAVAQSEHPWLLRLDDFFNRSPETHGRSIGYGEPLRGTSWLNRPFEVSYQFGAFVMPSAPAAGSQRDNDIFGSLHIGYDFDHYWGVEFRLGGTTIEVNPPGVPGQRTSDTLTLIDLSTTYYPWGDSRTRPFFRLGAGLTDIEFTNGGVRQQESLFTVPVGIGIKHLGWRSLAWRAELINNFALGSNGADTMNNLTLTFGLEHRFGGVPQGYWAWRPRGTVER